VTIKDEMDTIYGGEDPGAIPWNIEEPPDELVRIIDGGWVLPCEAVDLGCGAGNYVVWLASRGFQVTGIDISQNAIALARDLAKKKGLSCRFVVGDMTGVIEGLDAAFDFAYDWSVLHHVFPESRSQYVANVHRMLRSGAKYLSVCFSAEDPNFGGIGKYRETPLGTTLYFSSEKELKALFEPLFHIGEMRTIEIQGKLAPNLAVEVMLSKR